MADDEIHEGEEGQQDLAVPELWRLAKPPVEVIADEEGAPPTKPPPAPGPLIGKLVKLLNDIEEPEEFETRIQERDPATMQSLLMWATLSEKFVLVEWLVKKGKRAAFALDNNAKDLTVYDKWIEIRKEIEDKEKEKAENPPEEEPADDDEPKAPEPTPDQLVYEALSDLHEEFGARGPGFVKRIGELGIYQGARNEDGAKQGLGQAMFPNGDLFCGEYKDNKRHGKGTYYFANEGIIYCGGWRNNLREGLGRIVYPDGGRYYGAWIADKKHGEGRYTYPDGSSFSGAWVCDVREGFGTYTFVDGSQYIGTFSHGEFIGGEWRLAGGTRYYGAFTNGKPFGKGVFVFKHGKDGSYRQEGSFVDGVWRPGPICDVDAPPHIDVIVQKKPLTISFTEECAALPIDLLVHVYNFPPLQKWLTEAEKTQNFFINGIQVSSVTCGSSKEIISVRLKVNAVDAQGARLRGAEQTLLCKPTTKLLVMLVGGDKTLVLLQKAPNAAMGASEYLDVPSVEESPGGAFAGTFAETAASALRLALNKKNTLPIPQLQGVLTSVHSSNARVSLLAFAQAVHPDAIATAQQRLDDACKDFGPLFSVRAVRLSEIPTLSTDATTICAVMTVQKMMKEGAFPLATAEPQRPPTPIPPPAEPRPDIEPLLQKERAKKVQITEPADD